LYLYSIAGSTRSKFVPVGCICDLHFGGRGGRRGLMMVPFKRVMFSYGFSVVTSKLYLTIHVQYAIECLPRLDQQRVGHFGAKCWGKD